VNDVATITIYRDSSRLVLVVASDGSSPSSTGKNNPTIIIRFYIGIARYIGITQLKGSQWKR
jgi:hypothetical protein